MSVFILSKINRLETKPQSRVESTYMEQGSFSRGDDKGTTPAEAGIVFNGNIEGDIPSIARTTHLLTPLPENIRNDDAFHDRWHAYLPGWEMAKLVPEHFTS